MFEGGLGTMEGFKAKIFVDPDATPHFSKAIKVSTLCLSGQSRSRAGLLGERG